MQPIESIAEKIPSNYPRTFSHIGNNIYATQLMCCMTRKQAAKIIGCNACTALNWGRGRVTKPALRHWPDIIRFLGHCPYQSYPTLPEKVVMWKTLREISMTELAKQLQLDERTIAKFECHERLIGDFHESLSKKMRALLDDSDFAYWK